MKIKPLGNKILVLPIKSENHITGNDIEVVNNTFDTGEVIEFSTDLASVYKKGDILLYHKGCGISQVYNNKAHLWLNGNGAPSGDIWAIIGNSKDKK